jgi:hypothetical protein
MSMAYIRRTYKVPAKRGGRVRYTWPSPPQTGTIVGARGPHLRIRLDGEKHSELYHPTWEIEYLETVESEKI